MKTMKHSRISIKLLLICFIFLFIAITNCQQKIESQKIETKKNTKPSMVGTWMPFHRFPDSGEPLPGQPYVRIIFKNEKDFEVKAVGSEGEVSAKGEYEIHGRSIFFWYTEVQGQPADEFDGRVKIGYVNDEKYIMYDELGQEWRKMSGIIPCL